MRIAIVTETFLPAIDGIVTRLTKAIDYFERQGHDVLVICPDIDGRPDDYKGAKVVGIKAYTFFFYKQRPWALPSRKVKSYLEDFNPDIVHAVNPFSMAASGVYYAKRLQIPLICSYHTNMPDYMDYYHFGFLKPLIWAYIRFLHNQAPINMVTSQAMYDLLESHGIHGLRILPKGVDLENRNPRFFSQEWRDEILEGTGADKILLFVGRLAPEKQIETLLPLMERREDVYLVIAGDGPDRDHLEEVFKETKTKFLGFKTGKELSTVYASADAFIFPSVTETLGLVILEAMASGTPVIAARSEPTLEQIKDGENGLIYRQDSIEDLSYCIDRLEDGLLRDYIVGQGIDYADQFSWDNASQAMLDDYQEAISLSTIQSSIKS